LPPEAKERLAARIEGDELAAKLASAPKPEPPRPQLRYRREFKEFKPEPPAKKSSTVHKHVDEDAVSY